MLTIFACPKPFTNPHTAIIQCNAIQSWLQLRPACEVILLGNDDGTAEVAQEFGLRHVPDVVCNEFGTPLLNSIFERAQAAADHCVLSYVNADIILLSDFMAAVEKARSSRRRYLLVGQRWDVDITTLLEFRDPKWAEQLEQTAKEHGNQRPPNWIDYFVFSKGVFQAIPPLALGRTVWDNWLIWSAAKNGADIIDASKSIIAVHQNHDYSHVPGGAAYAWAGEEAKRNNKLAGGWSHFYTIEDATYRLTRSGIKRNLGLRYFRRRGEMARRWLVDWTRPLRHQLGVRKTRS